MSVLSDRLRQLLEANNWTVMDMAERTNIPKRTLDKYLLREGASLPGFEALCALSKGLGVSLDWLVFGAEPVGTSVELITDRAAYGVALKYFETLLKYHNQGDKPVFNRGEILGLSPEEWAADLSVKAGEAARKIAQSGSSQHEILTWKSGRDERLWETVRGRISKLTEAVDGSK